MNSSKHPVHLYGLSHRPINRYGRPDNWADRTVDALLDAYAQGGKLAASSAWLDIVDRDKPLQVDANVALGRFNQILKETVDE